MKFFSSVAIVCMSSSLATSQVSSAPGSVNAVPSVRNTPSIIFSINPPEAALDAAELEVKENGKIVPVVHFQRLGRVPIHYCLLVDTSGSEAKHFDLEKKAVITLIERGIKPGLDHGWIVLFESIGQESTETTNPQLFESLITSATAHGGTSLYDAITSCASRMPKDAGAQEAKELRTMFLFTDGEDDASRVNHQQAINAVVSSGLRVYAFVPRSIAGRAEQMITVLIKSAGGMLFWSDTGKDAERNVEHLCRDLDGLAEISYEELEPSGLSPKSLEIKSRKKGLSVIGPKEITASR